MKYLLFLLIILMISCKKDDIDFFSGEDGVAFYVNTGEGEADSLSYSFAFSRQERQRDTVYLKMRVLGAAAGRPRKVTVQAGAGSTARAGIDYILPEVTIPADSLTVRYPVILLNSPEMVSRSFRLFVEVVDSDDLKVGAIGREIGFTTAVSTIKIDVSNMLVQPSYWNNLYGPFGTYSAVKLRFMMSVTGLTDFSDTAIGIDGTYNLPVLLRNALTEYEAANGPLIDENGNRVKF